LNGSSGAEAQAAVSPSAAPAVTAPSAWWVRMLSHLPFPVLYGVSSFLGWLAHRVFPYRQHVVRKT